MSIEEAEKYKEKANGFLRDGKYEEAIKEYNKAISLDASNAVYLSNRSAAWAAWGKYDNALSDANKCLDADKKFVKGYSRKGLALYKLGRVKDAMAAYQAGLLVDPQNASLQQAITSMQQESSKNSFPANFLNGNFLSFLKGTKFEAAAEKLMQNSAVGKLAFYLLVFGVYYMWTSFGGKDSSSPKKEENTEPNKLQHKGLTLGPGKNLHIVKRAALGGGMAGGGSSGLSESTRSSGGTELVLGSSIIFFHAHGLSAEEYVPVYKHFENFNIIGVDLPCHGRSGCWSPVQTGEWEEIAKKLVTSEAEFLGKNRIMILSGFAPYLTRQFYDQIEPVQVVWTEPNKLGIDSSLYKDAGATTEKSSKDSKDGTSKGSTSKDSSKDGDSKGSEGKWTTLKLVEYLDENYGEEVPMPLMRDILNWIMIPQKDSYIPKQNVTELIMDEVLTAPHLILDPLVGSFSDKRIRTVREGRMSLSKTKQWANEVLEWFEESPQPEEMASIQNPETDDDF